VPAPDPAPIIDDPGDVPSPLEGEGQDGGADQHGVGSLPLHPDPPPPGGRGRSSHAELSLPRRFLAAALAFVVRCLAATLRVVVVGPEPPANGRSTVFAFLHGSQVGLLRYPRPSRTAVLASLSRDGALQARVLASLGFDVVRGSSSRGGDAGLVALVRAVKRGAAAAIAVDGPRGPRGAVKPGALFVARATAGVVVPVACAASSCLRLRRSWDHFAIPAPWSRVVLVRGAPIEIPAARAAGEGAGGGLEPARLRLEQELAGLTEQAERVLRGDSNGGA
jgi:lysophospholipid acyltransferase (LPLAT)-like uncharacterized protein